MQSDKGIQGISCGLVDENVFEWEVMLMIADDCPGYGGRWYPIPFSDYGLQVAQEEVGVEGGTVFGYEGGKMEWAVT